MEPRLLRSGGGVTPTQVEVRAEDRQCYPVGGIRLQCLADVGVDVGSHPLAGVVQTVLHNLHRDACFERERGPAVAQRVQIDKWQRGVRVDPVVPSLSSLELAGKPVRLEVVAIGPTEDEITSVIPREFTPRFR